MVADHNKVYKEKGRASQALPSLSAIRSKTEGVIIAHASDSGIIVQSQRKKGKKGKRGQVFV